MSIRAVCALAHRAGRPERAAAAVAWIVPARCHLLRARRGSGSGSAGGGSEAGSEASSGTTFGRSPLVGTAALAATAVAASAAATSRRGRDAACEAADGVVGTDSSSESGHRRRPSPSDRGSSDLDRRLPAPTAPEATVLAGSPSSSSSPEATLADPTVQIERPPRATVHWWHCSWWRVSRASPGREASWRRWWRRLRQTFFVATRGLEIVVRLSPLLVLTPAAVAVSRYVDPMWKTCLRTLGCEAEAIDFEPLLATEGLDERDDDDVFARRFTHRRRRRRRRAEACWASDLAWTYALHALQSLGPAFVKLGQWAATRRDLFPATACDRLSELHDGARVHAWEITDEALAEAFGEDYEARGLVVAKGGGAGGGRVLGSGSAAQVHEGTLTLPPSGAGDDGGPATRSVAVKVLHPRTRELVERDLALMRHAADLVDKYVPFEAVRMMSLPRATSNFADVMTRQVDLRVEGENLIAFRENFGLRGGGGIGGFGGGGDAVAFPRPEPGWTSERVLVEEYAGDDAVPISRYLADDSPEGLRKRKVLAGHLMRAILKMVFVDNFIHADLHPGNVLVREVPSKANPKRSKFTIIILDAGIATSLQPNDRKNLHDLFKAVVLNDGYAAGALMVERARYEKCTSVPGGKHAFASGVSGIVSEFHDRRKRGLTLGAVRVGSLLVQVLDLCRIYGVEIDPAMSSVVVSMLVAEGLGRSLDSDLNLIKAAVPFLLGGGKV